MTIQAKLWVLCPPERGQGAVRFLQRELASQDIMAVALPPFLPLGRRDGEEWLSSFHTLGSWEISGNFCYREGILTAGSSLKGLEGFLKGFERVSELPNPELTLSLVKGIDPQDLKGQTETFHSFDLLLWDLTLEWAGEFLKRVEFKVLRQIHKKDQRKN